MIDRLMNSWLSLCAAILFLLIAVVATWPLVVRDYTFMWHWWFPAG